MVTSLSMLTNRLTFPHRLIIVMTAGPYLQPKEMVVDFMCCFFKCLFLIRQVFSLSLSLSFRLSSAKLRLFLKGRERTTNEWTSLRPFLGFLPQIGTSGCASPSFLFFLRTVWIPVYLSEQGQTDRKRGVYFVLRLPVCLYPDPVWIILWLGGHVGQQLLVHL